LIKITRFNRTIEQGKAEKQKLRTKKAPEILSVG
jgi:hypothetical protein